MKKLISTLLSALFFTMEICGWFFVYAFGVYFVTDGAMCGRWGVLAILVAAVLSAVALIATLLKRG